MVITTDVFRCREFGVDSVVPNVRWLRGLLYNVFPATDFVQTIFAGDCDDGEFDIAGYRRAHDLPNDRSGWASLVNTPIADVDDGYFAELLDAALVIGWGLTPALMQLLDRHRIPFVDVEVDPIRFGDDLLLRVRTNSPALSGYFSTLHTDEAIFATSVAGLRAFVARLEAATLKAGRPFGLFAGQFPIDLSIVSDGRIVEPAARIDDIRAIAASVDTLYVKPHPGDQTMQHITVLLDTIPNARLTRSNIYRILSDINLKHVVALSSSVLDEAAQFGVATTRLIDPDRDSSPLIPRSMSRWYRIAAEDLATTDFVNAFRGSSAPRSNAPRRHIDLRRSLNTSWGFEDLYTQAALPLSIAPRYSQRPSRYRRAGRAIKSILRQML
ncbi:hypothetical protein [Bradyrhizobium prioriisuperbiae]|uniref:hypothetical protein n=1 Tax=Bradyrhizobium prioriisuperbiae TaxID=2854389 RepID=UPI0028EF07B9|nr:hypothetical protein [Bradyrhizobium prioritasuperba]